MVAIVVGAERLNGPFGYPGKILLANRSDSCIFPNDRRCGHSGTPPNGAKRNFDMDGYFYYSIFSIIMQLEQRKLNAYDAVILLIAQGIKLVNLVLKPFHTFTAKLCGIIMRE